MTSLAALRSRYFTIARRLDAPALHVRFATRPTHDGGPHVERLEDRWCYVVSERGAELERRETSDPDELLYWLVSDLTRAMASDHETAHRAPAVDVRRLLFAKHVELLATVSSGWAERKRTEYAGVLVDHPFVDGGEAGGGHPGLRDPEGLRPPAGGLPRSSWTP